MSASRKTIAERPVEAGKPDTQELQTIEVSDRLLNSPLVRSAPSEPELARRFEMGMEPTKPAKTIARSNDQIGYASENSRSNRSSSRRHRKYNRGKSRGRKRTRGGDGRLPNTLREYFTEGERSVLSVIAGECMRNGRCELPNEKIAAIAGCSIRLVQNTLAKASGKDQMILEGGQGGRRTLDGAPVLLEVEYRPVAGGRNLPNVVAIVSREWLSWLKYKPSEAPTAL